MSQENTFSSAEGGWTSYTACCLWAPRPSPPMGWNAWNRFAGEVSKVKTMAIADAMVASVVSLK